MDWRWVKFPGAVSDPPYYRDGAAATYRPLDRADCDKIRAGEIRI